MKALWKEHPALVAAVFATVVVVLAGLFFGFQQRGERAKLRVALDRLEAQARGLEAASPAPSPENLGLLRADRRAAEATAAGLLASLTETRQPLVGRPYGGAEELYFEIASFIEAMRARATASGVSVRPAVDFGFASFVAAQQIPLPAGASPSETAELLGRVDVQLQALEIILGRLFEAKPRLLEAVERTPVAAVARTASRRPAEELFEMDPLVTAAVPGTITTQGYRITFSGRTHVLRDFLVAAAEWPEALVVRSVEVVPLSEPPATTGRPAAASANQRPEPAPVADSPFAVFGVNRTAPAGGAPAAASAPAANAPVPIIGANESRFVVVLESYAVAPDASETEEEAW